MNNPEIKKKLEELIDTELEAIVKEHGEFVDLNQAESVLNAEIAEAMAECNRAEKYGKDVRRCTWHHAGDAGRWAKACYDAAVRLLEEAVQVAAVCKKIMRLQNVGKDTD